MTRPPVAFILGIAFVARSLLFVPTKQHEPEIVMGFTSILVHLVNDAITGRGRRQ